MSGIDEQIRDFPKCTSCKRFGFWIGKRNPVDNSADDMFFNPLSFRGSGGKPVPVYDNPLSRVARVEELDEVVKIKCDGCKRDADLITFNQILYAAKYLIREWESKHVGN